MGSSPISGTKFIVKFAYLGDFLCKKEGGVPHISNAGPALIAFDYTPIISQNQ